MKHSIRKKVYLDLTLDCSESVMYAKGGKHKVNFDSFYLQFYDSDGTPENVELEISIQMERNEKSRFDFINGEAERHKERVNNEKPI